MKTFLRTLPMLTFMLLIFILSGRQRTEIPDFGTWDLLVKKLAHLTAYALLMLFSYTAVGRWRTAFLITILYAISDELHQTLVPTRHGTLADVLIDTAGAALMWLIYPRWLAPRLTQLTNRFHT